MNLETVKAPDGELLALILYQWQPQPGIRFFTDPEHALQLGCMKHPVGKHIDAHVHAYNPRFLTRTAEVLFIKSGAVKIDFYDESLADLSSRVLTGGDIVLLLAGGHGCEVLEEAELWEVKLGPYMGERDKIRKGADHGTLPET